MKDLFETPELIPADVMNVFDTSNPDGNEYWELERVLMCVRALGYTFDYYLDGEPFALRPIDVPLNKIEGYE